LALDDGCERDLGLFSRLSSALAHEKTSNLALSLVIKGQT